jgi:hypothetical protein
MRALIRSRHQHQNRHQIYLKNRTNFQENDVDENTEENTQQLEYVNEYLKLKYIIENWDTQINLELEHIIEKLNTNQTWINSLNHINTYEKRPVQIYNLLNSLVKCVFLKSFIIANDTEIEIIGNMIWNHRVGQKRDSNRIGQKKNIIEETVDPIGIQSEKRYEGSQCINCKNGQMIGFNDSTPLVDFVCNNCHYTIELKTRNDSSAPYRITKNQARFLFFSSLIKKYNINLNIIRMNCMVIANKNGDSYSYVYLPVDNILDGFITSQYSDEQIYDFIKINPYFEYTLKFD